MASLGVLARLTQQVNQNRVQEQNFRSALFQQAEDNVMRDRQIRLQESNEIANRIQAGTERQDRLEREKTAEELARQRLELERQRTNSLIRSRSIADAALQSQSAVPEEPVRATPVETTSIGDSEMARARRRGIIPGPSDTTIPEQAQTSRAAAATLPGGNFLHGVDRGSIDPEQRQLAKDRLRMARERLAALPVQPSGVGLKSGARQVANRKIASEQTLRGSLELQIGVLEDIVELGENKIVQVQDAQKKALESDSKPISLTTDDRDLIAALAEARELGPAEPVITGNRVLTQEMAMAQLEMRGIDPARALGLDRQRSPVSVKTNPRTPAAIGSVLDDNSP